MTTDLNLDVGAPSTAIEFDSNVYSDIGSQHYLLYLLKGTLDHHGVALHLFYEHYGNSDCLRVLACIPRARVDDFRAVGPDAPKFLVSVPIAPQATDPYVWYETFPAPGVYAKRILKQFAAVAGCGLNAPMGRIRFIYDGQKQCALVQYVSDRDVRVYFTDARPKFIVAI